MTSDSPEVPNLEIWSNTLLGALAASGVTHVVASPGSRSTPFLAAALAAGLSCHRVMDERSAGFFALGLARSTGVPPLLLCTSGTAGAHYYPAVMEASAAGLPVLILTADRPLELMDCAAPQTVDQVKLFGDQVRAFFELGEPVAGREALDALVGRAALALNRSVWPWPGPVHLNARAKKPLEPAARRAEDELFAGPERVPRYGRPTSVADPRQVADVVSSLAECGRGLIVVGAEVEQSADLKSDVLALARSTGFPLAAEAASGLKFGLCKDVVRVANLGLLLESEQAQDLLLPQVLVQVGQAPMAGKWPQWLRSGAARGLRHVVMDRREPSDVARSASDVLLGDVGATASALRLAFEALDVRVDESRVDGPEQNSWCELWKRLDGVVGSLVEKALETEPWSEGSVANRLVQHFGDLAGLQDPEAAAPVLALSNSLPIRLVETYAGDTDRDVEVLAQRGVNGIDGLVAGLAGAVAGRRPSPTALLIGDVALLHDLGSLQLLRAVTDRPVLVVVLNNDGGRIFEQLPIANPDLEQPLEFWTTPHGLGFENAAQHAKVGYSRATSMTEFDAAVGAALSRPGPHLLEVESGPGRAAELQRRLVGDVAQRFAGESA